jgi:hypothetical protein
MFGFPKQERIGMFSFGETKVEMDRKPPVVWLWLSHLLSQIPYKEVPFESPSMPKLKKRPEGVPEKPMFKNFVPEIH